MVGETYTVVVSERAKQRRKRIFSFETRANDLQYARRVIAEISAQLRKLSTLPNARPVLPDHDSDVEIRYTKAYGYKIIYHVDEQDRVVTVLTIRRDTEEPAVVFADL